MPMHFLGLLKDTEFQRRLQKRLQEGWTFEKVEPVSAAEPLARFGVSLSAEQFAQDARRHDSAEGLNREWEKTYPTVEGPAQGQATRQPKECTVMFSRYLMHERLPIRFGALLALVAAAFLGAWTLSYVLLPEGILRGRNAAQALAGNDLAGGSVWLEWLRICAINIGVMFVLVVAPNILRTSGDYPLGYSTVTLLAIVFGVTLGTNSFTVSLGGKLAPTLDVFASSGIYEIAAYVLAAAATTSIARYRLLGRWPKQTVEAVAPAQSLSVIQERSAGMLAAIVILLLATGWEAYRFSLAIAP